MSETTANNILLPLEITALAPLVFAERKAGVQFRDSLRYVPGATLFGALGALLGNTLEAASFTQLFQQLRCHNAYPMQPGDAWVRPLPRTAIAPKGAEPDHVPYDSLVERVCWEQQQPAALIYSPTDDNGRPWDTANWPFYALNGNTFKKRSITQRVLTRVSINRQRGTAEDERLYSPLVLTEASYDKEQDCVQPTRFLGSLVLPATATEVQAALGQITHLGGRQSSGLGAVTIQMRESTAADTPTQILERITQLTKRFQDCASLYATLHGQPWEIGDRSIFTINLLADAILFERGWLPTIEFNAQMLYEATGIEAELRRSFTSSTHIGGWHVMWQRPKPSAVAVRMGSVYVFQTKRSLTAADCAALAHLQLEGIGERRAEGYGQVRICDEFHLAAGPAGRKEEGQ